MNRRILSAAMAMSLSVFAAQTVWAAPPSLFGHTASDKAAQPKPISFNMRNDSATALTIQAGDQQMTIAAGQTTALKLQQGTQITVVNATARLAAGSVLATVTSALQGNTLAVS